MSNNNELGDYKLAIETLADSSSNSVFANSGAEHACIVMSNIFRTAKKNVHMFCQNLKGDVSKGEYLLRLEDYLKNRGTISLLLEEEPSGQSEAIKIMRKYSNKVTIRVINPELLEARKKKGPINHFTIADDRMLRYETDIEKYTAVCSFNDPKTYSILTEVYNLLSDNSTIAAAVN